MKIGVKLLAYGCMLACVCSSDGLEKKISFKKKIIACKSTHSTRKVQPVKYSDDYITVWIHGVSLFRSNGYNLGLWPAHTFIEDKSMFGIGKDLVDSDPIRFPADKVIMYSWAGKFNYDECEKAAAQLYEALVKTIKEFIDHNKARPKIRIITFSYGGNIVFNLPKFKDPCNALMIDELIVLAWPAQQRLMPMVHDPMFKKVFNIYSPLDFVQIFDPQCFFERQGKAPLFTSRRLKKAANILQAKIHINGRGCGHFGLNNRPFVSMFPLVLDTLNDWFSYSQEHNLGLKKTRYMLSIYTDKRKAHKHKI